MTSIPRGSRQLVAGSDQPWPPERRRRVSKSPRPSRTSRASRSPMRSSSPFRSTAICVCRPKAREDTVDQVDKQFVPKVMAIAVGTSVFVSEQRQHSPSGLFVLAGQALRVAAVCRCPRPADSLRQAGSRRARLQHPRLDGRLHLRFGVALLRENRRQREGEARRSACRAPTSCASGSPQAEAPRNRRARRSTRRARAWPTSNGC